MNGNIYEFQQAFAPTLQHSNSIIKVLIEVGLMIFGIAAAYAWNVGMHWQTLPLATNNTPCRY
jgi:hypothetical protein